MILKRTNSFSFTLFSKENIVKAALYIYSGKLTNIFNERLIKGRFHDTLKRAGDTLIFKKGNDKEKENYLPVSMPSTILKVFEKLLFE